MNILVSGASGFVGSKLIPALLDSGHYVVGRNARQLSQKFPRRTERAPIMICPRWVTTRIQPIAIDDVISYLVAALDVPGSAGQTIDIGSPSIETYRTMMLKYAAHRGLRRPLLQVPVLTPRLSSYWVVLFTPVPRSISRPLIEGLRNEVVCRNNLAQTLLPQIHPLTYDEALERALKVPDLSQMASRRAEHQVMAQKALRQPIGEDEGWVMDVREGKVAASPSAVFAVVESIGGRRGWYYGTSPWRMRALLDRMVGGTGMGNGRSDPDTLRLGDTLDFWEVAALEPGRRLLLKARMGIPGEAYLQFDTFTAPDGATCLRSAALFRPRGLLGRIYWWLLWPVHKVIFKELNAAIRERALRGATITHFSRLTKLEHPVSDS